MLVPTIVDSDNAEFSTRPGNSVLKPRVTPKTSPFGSSMSSPTRMTRASVSSRCRSVALSASRIVNRGSDSSPRYSVRAIIAAGSGALTSLGERGGVSPPVDLPCPISRNALASDSAAFGKPDASAFRLICRSTIESV